MDETIDVSFEDAVARLQITPDYDNGNGAQDCVHTFRSTSFALLGAHYTLVELKKQMLKFGVEESGPASTAMNHGLVLIDENGPLFIETIPGQ